MGDLLDRRKRATKERFEALKRRLESAEKRSLGKACVYATGSFGRCEASRFSDLDLFIVGESTERGGEDGRVLSRLDEICVKADLIQVTRDLGIPEFSGDGEYLEHYTKAQLIRSLGRREDDANNTFTARLLLLLESQPLIEASVYDQVTKDVIAAYWRDYEDHRNEFMPAFLANDILRLWRTFCVNYEAGTSIEPPSKKAKRKLKNYKLKHSRLLTCYSALIYLLAVYSEHNTVRPDDAAAMIRLTPVERIEWLMEQEHYAAAHDAAARLLERYEDFLAATESTEETLIEQFMDKSQSRALMGSASSFGDSVFDLLGVIGRESRFYRLLVV